MAKIKSDKALKDFIGKMNPAKPVWAFKKDGVITTFNSKKEFVTGTKGKKMGIYGQLSPNNLTYWLFNGYDYEYFKAKKAKRK